MWSIALAIIGFFAAWAGLAYLERSFPERKPHHCWLVGLAGLFPAWLVSFLALLQPVTQGAADVPLPPRALFSSGAGLCGIIATDYLLRRMQKSGRAPAPLASWLLGLVALLPALLIALVSFK